MGDIKLNIGDSKTKKTYHKTLSDDAVKRLVGKKVGDKFRGEVVDLKGFEFEITGGSDNAGFPMRKGLHTRGRRKVLTAPGVGLKASEKNKKKTRIKHKGIRRKKTVRGEVIAEDISQINCKVVKQGKKSLADLLGEKKEEREAGEKKEEPKSKPKQSKSAKKETSESKKANAKSSSSKRKKEEQEKK